MSFFTRTKTVYTIAYISAPDNVYILIQMYSLYGYTVLMEGRDKLVLVGIKEGIKEGLYRRHKKAPVGEATEAKRPKVT